jgi:hypothetical protein
MAAFDHGFKIVSHTAGRRLAQMAGVQCTHWQPIVSEVETVERFADRAFRAAHGRQRFVVYLEAYTYADPEARWNMLAKSGLLSEREHLPTVCLLFVLHPRGYQSQHGPFRLQVGRRTTQVVDIREVCLWQRRPQPWWEESPGVMTLYPLSSHGQAPEAAVAHAAEVIARRTRPRIERADLLTILSIFGRLAYPDFNVIDIIGRQTMRESPLYQEILDEGRVEKARADVLAVLEECFDVRTAAAFAEAVNGLNDLDRLDQLHRLAVRCQTIDEFRAGLEAAQAPPRRAPRQRASRRRR